MPREMKSIGELSGDLFAGLAAQHQGSGPRHLKLIEAGEKIKESRPGRDEIAFMHSILCQIGLPRNRTDVERFERASGTATLEVRSGSIWDGQKMVPQFIPFGTIPRVILAYITTFAVRNKTPEIPFGDSTNEALRLLSITKSAERLDMFKKQMLALSSCRMTMGFNSADTAYTFQGSPIEQFEAWLPDRSGSRPDWPSRIVLGQRFFETLTKHAVPSDFRALSKLSNSALAIDVYLFLAARLHRTSKPTRISWKSLQDQFGQEYTGKRAPDDFRRAFLTALEAARKVYPDANVSVVRGAITLYPSRPPVDPKQSGRILAA